MIKTKKTNYIPLSAPAQALQQIQALKANLKELCETQKAIQNTLKTFEINQPDNLVYTYFDFLSRLADTRIFFFLLSLGFEKY
jgi:hypothetical protein